MARSQIIEGLTPLPIIRPGKAEGTPPAPAPAPAPTQTEAIAELNEIKQKQLSEDKNEYNFYNRMNEVANYTYSNKMDTIFVFQLTFISLLTFIILYYLTKNNIITYGVLWTVSTLLAIFVIFVYVNRLFVYNKIRDQRNWSRINFGDSSVAPSNYIQKGVDGGENGAVPTESCRAADDRPVCTPL